jgi:hypothetical protein
MTRTRQQTSLMARWGGVSYLAVIAGGIFSQILVGNRLIVTGDPAATMQAIAAHEALWRAGLAAHLAYLMATVSMSVILYELTKSAGPAMARMALIFSMMCSTVEAVSLVQSIVPLALGSETAIAAFSAEQRQTLGYLAVRLSATGFAFGIFLFSGFCAITGALIWRSRLVPRVIGGMMMLAGAGYFADGLMVMLSPATRTMLFPWLLMPGFLGETALALWLTIRGARHIPAPSPG